MRSVFEVGFRGNFQSPRLGQFDWGSLVGAIPGLIKTGVDVYQAREAEKAAEKAREKAQAAAAAAQAKLEEQKALQAQLLQEQAKTAAMAPQEETILGLPRTAAILGGLGLLAVIGIIAVVK